MSILSFLFSSCGDSEEKRKEQWPWADLPFLIIDEDESKILPERTENFTPTADRVLLLPVILNYRNAGKDSPCAITDPIVVVPGEKNLRELLSPLEHGVQTVTHCIVVSRGYAPGYLGRAFNYSGNHKGKKFWLIELTKLDSDRFNRMAEIVKSELLKKVINVELETFVFDQCLTEGKYLSILEIQSPIDKTRPSGSRGYRDVIFFAPNCSRIDVRLSPEGLEVLMKELRPLENDL